MCFNSKCFGKKLDAQPMEQATGPRPANFQPRSESPTPPSSPTNNIQIDQPKDDASIIRQFALIDNGITDHVLNYYISSNAGSEKFSQFGKDKRLERVLRAAPPSLLKESRTQVIVIRAIIGYEVFKAIQDDYFIPPVNKKLKVTKKKDPKWRQSYFQSLSTNPSYRPHRDNAIDTLTKQILKMTKPLAASADRVQEDARENNLRVIVENAAEFAITIGKQNPSFEIIFPRVRSTSRASRSSSRRSGSPGDLEVPVLVPELRKYGDERGRNYEQFLTLIPVKQFPEFSPKGSPSLS